MQTQAFEIQYTHPPVDTADPFAHLALEESGGSLEWMHLARLRAILLELPSPPIPKQLHYVVLGALDPLLQLVTNARGDRVTLQISLDALRSVLALERVQDRQAAEDLQVREDGGVVFLVVNFDVLASGR